LQQQRINPLSDKHLVKHLVDNTPADARDVLVAGLRAPLGALAIDASKLQGWLTDLALV
jgi:hypothetical protein